ncbi:hypothetical protein RhiirB3_448116 [Rhizophagus irregularis]|nr:hypothetical protein RhiirB3_448116 [Rhizophagus irregularis]
MEKRKGSGGLPKNGKPKDSFKRVSEEQKPKDSRSSRLPCFEERKKPRFDWMGFRVPKNGKIPKIRSNGLLTFGKRGTKIRLAVSDELLKNEKNQVSFCVSGGLLKNRGIKIRLGRLLRIRKRRTKVRLASEDRRNQDSFWWASKE